MIDILMSELDFDYELKALVKNFFPGQIVKVKEFKEDDISVEKDSLIIDIKLSQFNITVCIMTKSFSIKQKAFVTGDDDWHKHIDKSTHTYRTYYKNVLKKMVFMLLKDFPEDMLPEGMVKYLPVWGTMTGVRPIKIVMDNILKNGNIYDVRCSLENEYCLNKEKAEFAIEIALREAKILKERDYENDYSLYIGIPFCPTTCLYCSFTSYPFKEYLADAYIDALIKEIKYSSQIFKNKKLSSVYIGGGTPISLTLVQLEKLLSALKKYFPINKLTEFTVEAGRPDSITEEKLKVLYEYGVGRISVNPQTMQQKTLDLIGRKHTVRQTEDAFNIARKIGFNNINMDLITGLPDENENDFADTLSKIEKLNPDSLTIHSLVVKRASKLRDKLQEQKITDVTKKALIMENMFKMGQRFAKEHGYKPYYMYRQKNSEGFFGSTGQENTGYAVEGKECIYNILIMEEKQTILALGAGASTKLYYKDRKQVERIENVKNVNDYIERIGEMIGRKKSIYGRLYKENYGK